MLIYEPLPHLGVPCEDVTGISNETLDEARLRFITNNNGYYFLSYCPPDGHLSQYSSRLRSEVEVLNKTEVPTDVEGIEPIIRMKFVSR